MTALTVRRLLDKPLRLSARRRGLWALLVLPRRKVAAAVVRAHDRVLGLGQAPLELADALPDRGADLGQPLGSEQEQHDHQDEHDFA